MLFDLSRFAVSTCPSCAETSNIQFSIFNLSGKKSYHHSCQTPDCCQPIWDISKVKDKYKITVNCPACEEVHSYTISRKNFWSKKYFSLNCPTWEVGILYFGTDEKYILSQLTLQDDYINDMLSDVMDYDDTFSLMYDIIECINDISKSGNVECQCQAPDIAMMIEENKIHLTCKNCNREKNIPVTEASLRELEENGTIVL